MKRYRCAVCNAKAVGELPVGWTAFTPQRAGSPKTYLCAGCTPVDESKESLSAVLGRLVGRGLGAASKALGIIAGRRR